MTDGTSNLAPLTDEQYAELTRVSCGVDRKGYDAFRRLCPHVSHEEFVRSQAVDCPPPLYVFAELREVATPEEAEEAWKATREGSHTDTFVFAYNRFRMDGQAHEAALLSAAKSDK